MVKSSAIYKGEKHCVLTHQPSQSQIGTDAPVDNNGRGLLFSPTDLLGAATASCMLTIMAIVAEKDGVDIRNSTVDVEKEMVANPRKIGTLRINIHLPASVPADYRPQLEKAGLNCPVKLSLHPSIDLPVLFHYDL